MGVYFDSCMHKHIAAVTVHYENCTVAQELQHRCVCSSTTSPHKSIPKKQTVEWLSTIARRLLRPLPLKALTVLTHAFLPQLTYEGETAIASQPFVSKASLDGMEVTATAIACGQGFLHEFSFQFPSSRAPVAFWIPGYDKTYTAAQWYERYWSSIQLNLDEGTVACLHMPVLIRVPCHPFAIMCWRKCQPAWTIVPSQTWRVNGGHWAFVPVYSRRHCL